jgi:hypothetical protein
MAMEIEPTVAIVTAYGGYLVRSYVWDPEEQDNDERFHVCVTIEEVLARVRESLESQDRQPERDYDRIGKR